ncbi:MAG TPA: BamA/TamA family outer membrane protein, partial [Kofleriaceae bacterium]|nr:BamA/TamA family outer membrane protein [Kofleriaceae bacterium]
ALFPARAAVTIALAPIHGAVWAQETYHLDDLYYRVFFNADRTIGLYPTGTYASGFGITAGARFVARDLLGEHEAVALQATTGALTGDDYHESALISADTGERLGRLQLGVEGSFDRRPNDPFYGIGNAHVGTPTGLRIDPRDPPVAVSTHYRYQEQRAALFADVQIAGQFHARVSSAIANHGFGRSTDGPPIDQVFEASGLIGWVGFDTGSAELELRIDERRRASEWEPADLHGEGWLAAAALGRVHRLDNGGRDFWHGSAEVQEFIHLARGPRLLALRARGEAVSGSTMDVPFSELPMLGGGDFLRGYDYGRFRDRIAVLGSAEYLWDLSHWFAAALFVDAGRVYSSVDDVTLSGTRVGFGAALEISKDDAFLFETSISSSIDGGLFLNVSFNPVFDSRPRWR